MGRQFVAQLEDTLKKELMHHKSAQKSIDFDEIPPQRRDQLVFTPPRKARERIPPSQEMHDFERDSLASTSSRSIRKRLQGKFRVVGSKKTSDFTPAQIQEWLHETARAEMLKAGDYEEIRTKREMLGGFVRSHVSVYSFP